MIHEENANQTIPAESEFSAAFGHLQKILSSYLKNHPNLTISGMSKRCAVSEPTLRRINSGQVKTLPSVTTVIELLMYMSKESSAQKILEHFPGPLADYLKDKLPQIVDRNEVQFSEKLSQSLKDPVRYLIYKLAAMPEGVVHAKVVELFGSHGEVQLNILRNEELISFGDGDYHANIKNYSLSHDCFVEHFKTTADFIKPHKHAMAAKAYSPIFSNYSNGLTKKAYSEILKIQRAANKKIMAILNDKQCEGSIPTFVINAVDTLDTKCADEFD